MVPARVKVSLSVRIILISILVVAATVGALFFSLASALPAKQRDMVWIIGACGVLLLLALLWLVLRRLVIHPIKLLVYNARRLAAGDFVATPQVRRTDEIGLLTQAFDEMAASLRQRETRLVEESARRQEALRQESNRLSALSEIGQVVNSLQDVEAIFHFLVERARDVIQFEHFSIALLEPQNDCWSVAYTGGREKGFAPQQCGLDKGLTGWALRTGEPALVLDMSVDRRADTAVEQDLVQKGCRSAIVVPLRVAEAVVGTLHVVGQGVEAYSAGDLSLLTLLGRQVETALQNARLLERERYRSEQLRLLSEVSREITSILTVDALLQRVGEVVQQTFGYHRVNVATLEGKELVFRARVGEAGEQLPALRLDSDGPGITCWVAKVRQPTLVNDVTQDPRYLPSPPPEDEHTLSELAIPIVVGSDLAGVLDVQSSVKDAFNEKDQDLLQAVAGRLAIALENAFLYDRVRQERDTVELLYRVGQELSAAVELEEVLPKVLSMVVEKIGAYRGSIIVLDPLGNARHHILIREDLSPTVIRLLVQEILRRGLAGWVAQNRRPAIVTETRTDSRWLELPESVKGVRSALAVPLLRRDTLVAVLTLVHREPNYFNEKHLELVSSVANQAAIAIDNARLLLDTQRRVAQLNALLEINQSLSSDLPIQDLLELITLSAHGLLDASNTILYLLDEEGKLLVPQVALGADSVELRESKLKVGEGLSGLVVQTGRSYILNEAHLGTISKWVIQRPPEPEGLLSVPLLQKGVAVGALTVGRYGQGTLFGPSDQEVAELLASQAVVALQNARLYGQARRRADDMASLNRIAQTVGSTLKLQEVLRQVIQELNRSFHVEAGSILLLDEERHDLYFATTLEGGLERFLDVRIPVGRGLVGVVAETGRPEIVNNPANDPRIYSKVSSDVGFTNRNMICVPLISRDQAIGVIELLNKEGGDFDSDDLERLQGIAATVAVAIENAGLYEQTEEERGRLTAILISTADAVIATDAQQRILLINPAAAQAFKLEPKDLVGQPAGSFPHPGLRELFGRAVSLDHPFTDELVAESGQTFYASISPVRGAGEQTLGHVAVMQDITTLKELDKMKSEFVSVVSHDLKTPLTAIRGFADLVTMTGPLNEQQKEFAGRIKEITREMATMISDLLDIGKIEAGIEMEQAPCDMAGLADEVMHDLEFRAKEKNIVIAFDSTVQPAVVLGDPGRLKQVLMNLVGNAIKYTPDNGRVEIHLAAEEGRLITSVRDTGIGISLHEQKQLFQKFYRVRNDQTAHIEGTGLGLAICRSVVERHGGRIWVESEAGKGSIFAFSLPLPPAGTEMPVTEEGA